VAALWLQRRLKISCYSAVTVLVCKCRRETGQRQQAAQLKSKKIRSIVIDDRFSQCNIVNDVVQYKVDGN